ncbi:hypothetical protein [Streptomyces sp. NPDC048659]|uniref:hypothetical protein n=1 Tax=Streptomyces sp. NPDC048659 TaxID=3155489 RepID=UPI0034298B38
MISIIENIKTSTAKMTDRSVVSASALGFTADASVSGSLCTSASFATSALLVSTLPGTGMPVLGMADLLVERPETNERPTKALEAGVAGKATAYGFAATGAGFETKQQTTQHHLMWAFRGLEPWSDPA